TKTTLEHVGDGTTAKTAENDFAGMLAAGAEVELEKRSVVATSRDFDTQEALVARLDELAGQLDGQSFDDL
ncbi:hypothetical protein, partial [Agathobacter rectalis]|uniref:hypothetical protein n=1 Tax=Agathobacter rectalis TaxID=39491 RepID=UPI0027D24BCD